jgi:hypothetical protein
MIPSWLEGFPTELVERVDLGLEGDWSRTVRTVWSREGGLLGYDGAELEHATHRPAAELYLRDGWIGVHCFTKEDRGYRLDARRVDALIQLVRKSGG